VVVFALSYIANYGRSLLVSTHNVARMSRLQIVVALGNAGTIVFVLSMGWGLLGLAFGSMAFTVVRLTIFLVAGIRAVEGWRFRWSAFRRKVLKSLWTFGMVVQVTRFAELINAHFGRLLVGRTLGLSSVTHFDLGMKAAQSSGLLAHIVVYVIEPAAAALHSMGDRERLDRLMRDASRLMALVSFGLAAWVMASAGELLVLWLEDLPDPAVIAALRLLTLALVLEAVTLPLRLAARGTGHPEWSAQYSVVHAGLNIALSIGGYYVWGFMGILLGHAVASWVGYGLQMVVTLKGLKQPVGWFVVRAWSGPLLAAAAPGGFVWWLLARFGPGLAEMGRLEALPWVLGSAALYGGLLAALAFLFGIVRISEIRGLWDRMKG
jgi:O-antigen/teichoic acid export membrane protein